MHARTLFATAAIMALAAPAALAQQAGDVQEEQTGVARSATEQQMGEPAGVTGQAAGPGVEVAQQCMRDLQALNQEMIEGGYGLAGPQGHAMGPYAGYGYAAPVTTPRGEMRSIMTAAQIFALNGDQETCQSIVEGARELQQARMAQFEELGVPADEVTAWRANRLAAAVPATEMQGQVRVDDITGADVRNAAGEDLGDVHDVVFGPDGSIEYVVVARGGFLGIGQDLVPVRWADLRVTVAPADTVVLNVRPDVLENAPTIDGDVAGLTEDEQRRQQVDAYWDQHLEG